MFQDKLKPDWNPLAALDANMNVERDEQQEKQSRHYEEFRRKLVSVAVHVLMIVQLTSAERTQWNVLHDGEPLPREEVFPTVYSALLC